MTKLGWRMIDLDEINYGAKPVFRRAFFFFQRILVALEDQMKAKYNAK